MSASFVSNDLRQGIDSARAGHRLLARLHLAQAIDADPSNDAHWLWMAWVAESPDAALDHLKKALELNPGNEIARAGLIWSQTMASWDFSKSLSPRDTLAAVAEREAAANLTAPAFPIRMPRVDELHHESSKGYEEPSKEIAPPVDDTRLESSVEAVHEFDLSPAVAEAPTAPVAEAPDSPEQKPATESAAPSLEEARPASDPNRPESIPIDQLTGMFTGEGKHLLGGEFAGFSMEPDSVDSVQDPTASLATPFPGGQTVGRLVDRRPPSADLATPFAQAKEADSSEELSSGPESEFDTIPPQTNMPEAAAQAPMSESYVEIAPSGAETPDVDEPQADEPPARKVLIVDDSPTVCKIVSITLKKRGFEVASAGDGVEAMALIAADQPHLILLDITMPRMDGYQLCKLIKGYPQTKNIPVIMLSGKDGFFDRVRGKLVGCADYITKPFDPEMLSATVERFLPAPATAAVAS
jgi:CheY-like chemotaxis protein